MHNHRVLSQLDGAHEEVYEICLQNARGSKEDTKHVMLTVDKDSLPVGKDPGTLLFTSHSAACNVVPVNIQDGTFIHLKCGR